MKKKIVWVVVSCLMVAALLLSSCAPAVTEEEEVIAPPKEEKEVVTEEEVAPPPGEPMYGGVLNFALSAPTYGFDEGYVIPPFCTTLNLTHEDLMTGDWSKGPAGTAETTWQLPTFVPPAEVGCLAESWETPDEETVVLHIRHGVHWHDKPPVNGREMTADDVVFNLKRLFFSDLPITAGLGVLRENVHSVTAPDRYTVVVKGDPRFIWRAAEEFTEVMKILPPEAGGEYPGDFRDWRVCIGTGPFMLEDEVPGGSLTFVRNPNYWRNDPVHPENTLPYVDGVNILVIPDASTRLAALRTGKIAQLGRLSWEDRDSLVKTNPKLQWVGGLGMTALMGMRVDKPELPFYDIRVRRALAIGLDRQAIAETYYGGNAEVFAFPIMPRKEFKDMFVPLDEFPESIQELYQYNPEKTRQLLAEAGYPDGFKTEIVCTAGQADLLSIVKANWAEIGVDLELDLKEMGVFRGMSMQHTHKQMFFSGATADPQKLRNFLPGLSHNTSMVSDPYIDEIYTVKLVKSVWDWDTLARVYKEELTQYILEQCWYIDFPTPVTYTFWQPWLKGYHGEICVGHLNADSWPIYVWLDQELKKEMTGR